MTKDFSLKIVDWGGEVIQGDGSRVRFDLKGISLNIHSPHPQKELKRYGLLEIS